MNGRTVAFSLAGLILSGCERSASYYQAHDSDRAATLEDCKAGHRVGRECDNAFKAAAIVSHKDAENLFRSGTKRE